MIEKTIENERMHKLNFEYIWYYLFIATLNTNSICMNEIENHPFKPYVPKNATILIIGSFPGIEQVENSNNHEEWFYSAANNLFWPILSELSGTELKTRIQKEKFLTEKGIALTDIFTSVRRKVRSNLDRHLYDFEYNKDIVQIVEKSKIDKLFFTSKFVETHFLKAYPQIRFGICLPSPSPAANIPISKSNDYKLYKDLYPDDNTKAFRLYKYKQLLF